MIDIDYRNCPLCDSQWIDDDGIDKCPNNCGFFCWERSGFALEKSIGAFSICWSRDNKVCLYKEINGRYVGWTQCPMMPFNITEERFKLLLNFV